MSLEAMQTEWMGPSSFLRKRRPGRCGQLETVVLVMKFSSPSLADANNADMRISL